MELTIALGQMAIEPGRIEANKRTAQALAAQASGRGADLLMLPELWATGYDLDTATRHAAPLDAGPFEFMAQLATRYSLHILGTALEDSNRAPFNTATLYGPDGALMASYRKAHLFPPMGETLYMTPGNQLPTFDLPWGRTALAICYDLRFPELWRRYALAGAHLILIPSEWPVRRIEHWRLLLRARAVENQLFVAGCNRASAGADGTFGGHSAVVDPWGQVLVDGGAEAGLFLAKIDLAEVTRARDLFPFLDDRRPEIYT
jgi:predicted amidohydrolase